MGCYYHNHTKETRALAMVRLGTSSPPNHDVFYLQLLFDRADRAVPCATATNQIQQLMVDVYFSENIPWVWTWVLISMRSKWVGDRH